jgi:NAD(P)-dependent dehydrogenase (short-subunit alcohol dehydrogenase family)
LKLSGKAAIFTGAGGGIGRAAALSRVMRGVVAFDFASGEFLGTVVRFPRLYGQALAFFP